MRLSQKPTPETTFPRRRPTEPTKKKVFYWDGERSSERYEDVVDHALHPEVVITGKGASLFVTHNTPAFFRYKEHDSKCGRKIWRTIGVNGHTVRQNSFNHGIEFTHFDMQGEDPRHIESGRRRWKGESALLEIVVDPVERIVGSTYKELIGRQLRREKSWENKIERWEVERIEVYSGFILWQRAGHWHIEPREHNFVANDRYETELEGWISWDASRSGGTRGIRWFRAVLPKSKGRWILYGSGILCNFPLPEIWRSPDPDDPGRVYFYEGPKDPRYQYRKEDKVVEFEI